MTLQEFGMLYPHSEIKFKGLFKSPQEDVFNSFETELYDEPEQAYNNAVNILIAGNYQDEDCVFVEAVILWRNK